MDERMDGKEGMNQSQSTALPLRKSSSLGFFFLGDRKTPHGFFCWSTETLKTSECSAVHASVNAPLDRNVVTRASSPSRQLLTLARSLKEACPDHKPDLQVIVWFDVVGVKDGLRDRS